MELLFIRKNGDDDGWGPLKGLCNIFLICFYIGIVMFLIWGVLKI